MTEDKAFYEAVRKVISEDITPSGIGTLKEKSMHRILKLWIEPDTGYHEVKYLGKICDIKRDNLIYEIQTGGYGRLVPKLELFLKNNVTTVVIPLCLEKQIIYFDKSTSSFSRGRLSPHKEGVYHALYYLYNIRKQLDNENIRIKLVFVKAKEYKLASEGKTRGRRRNVLLQTVPTDIVSVLDLSSKEDYFGILPHTLSEQFTLKDFIKECKVKRKIAPFALATLRHIGVVEKVGNIKRANLYRIKNTNDDLPKVIK